jgi:hypothetical protein
VLNLRYQGTIIRTARECNVTPAWDHEGRRRMRHHRPAGGPGTVDVPLRIAIVHEGVNQTDRSSSPVFP